MLTDVRCPVCSRERVVEERRPWSLRPPLRGWQRPDMGYRTSVLLHYSYLVFIPHLIVVYDESEQLIQFISRVPTVPAFPGNFTILNNIVQNSRTVVVIKSICNYNYSFYKLFFSQTPLLIRKIFKLLTKSKKILYFSNATFRFL